MGLGYQPTGFRYVDRLGPQQGVQLPTSGDLGGYVPAPPPPPPPCTGGPTWALTTFGLPISFNFGSVAFGKGLFVAAGRNDSSGGGGADPAVAVTADGSHWALATGVPPDTSGAYGLYDIEFLGGPGRFVAGYTATKTAYSDDGENWNIVSGLSLTGPPTSCSQANGRYFIFSQIYGNTGFDYTSDGVTYARGNFTVGMSQGYVSSMAYFRGNYIALSRAGAFYNPDFTNSSGWVACTVPADWATGTSVGNSRTASDGSTLVMVNNGNTVTYSTTDGVTWSEVTPPGASQSRDILYTRGVWLNPHNGGFSGTANVAFDISNDAASWRSTSGAHSFDTYNYNYRIACNPAGTLFVAVPFGTYLTGQVGVC